MLLCYRGIKGQMSCILVMFDDRILQKLALSGLNLALRSMNSVRSRNPSNTYIHVLSRLKHIVRDEGAFHNPVVPKVQHSTATAVPDPNYDGTYMGVSEIWGTLFLEVLITRILFGSPIFGNSHIQPQTNHLS